MQNGGGRNGIAAKEKRRALLAQRPAKGGQMSIRVMIISQIWRNVNMKQIFEFFGLLAVIGEYITIYTAAGCIINGEPFPAWFYPAAYLLAGGTIAVIIGAVVCLATRRVRNRRRRLGMIKIEGKTGRVYLVR